MSEYLKERGDILPPPHWPSKPDFGRHPKTAEEWDVYKHRDKFMKRLNFNADLADPRAPDQMTIVSRMDLMSLKYSYIRANALAKNRADRISTLTAERDALLQSLEDLDMRERQELGAGISLQSWNKTEQAHNRLRDKLSSILMKRPVRFRQQASLKDDKTKPVSKSYEIGSGEDIDV